MKRAVGLLLLFAAALGARAAVETTQIVGRVLMPSGAPATGGSILAELLYPGAGDDGGASSYVLGRTEASIAADGSVDFTLVPNELIDPQGTTYRIKLTVTGPIRYSRLMVWSVPQSETAVYIGDVSRLDEATDIWLGDYVRFVSDDPDGTACATVEAPRYVTTTQEICYCSTGTGLWVCPASGSGATTFLGLIDTPDSYVGQAGLATRVNVGETALEFFDPATQAVAAVAAAYPDLDTDGTDDLTSWADAVDLDSDGSLSTSAVDADEVDKTDAFTWTGAHSFRSTYTYFGASGLTGSVGHIYLYDEGQIRFHEPKAAGDNYFYMRAPSMAANIGMTMPSVAAAATGQAILSTGTATPTPTAWTDVFTQTEYTTHAASADHDGRYYTETETGTLLDAQDACSEITGCVESAITAGGVTYENLSANGDVGTGSAQVSQGNHDHSAAYQPLDAELTTVAGLVEAQGSIIVGNATPEWSTLAIGGAGGVLLSNGTTPSWDTSPAIDCTDCTNVDPKIGTLTAANLCTESSGQVACTVNTEAEFETRIGGLDFFAATAGDFTTAAWMTALSDEGASTTVLHGGGAWGQIGDSDIAAGAAVDSDKLASDVTTRYAFALIVADPDAAAVNYVIDLPPWAGTMTQLNCEAHGGTSVTIDLCDGEDYADDTCATSVLGAALECTTSGASDATLSSAGFAARDKLSLVITAESGTVDRLNVTMTATVD